MKQSLKRNYFFVLFSLVSLLLYSCAEEKEFVKEENRKVIKFEQKTLDEVLQISTFNKAYQKLVKKNAKIGNSALAKSALEEEYDFTIVPDVIKIITSEDGTVSYNMLIEREGLTTSYFENLVLQNDTLNNTDAFLLKYTPSETMTAIPYHDSFSFEGTSEAEQIVTSGKIFFLPGGCVLITNTLCYFLVPGDPEFSLPHPPSSRCTIPSNISTTTSLICPSILGGGGTNPTTISTPSNTGTSTNNNGGLGAAGASPILVATVPCRFNCIEEDTAVQQTPCERLKEITSATKGNMLNKLGNLGSIIQDKGENGYHLKKSPGGVYTYVYSSGGEFNLPFVPHPDVYCFIHTHPHGASPVMSFSDLVMLNKVIKSASLSNKPNVSLMLVVDGGYYAITVNNEDYQQYHDWLVQMQSEILAQNMSAEAAVLNFDEKFVGACMREPGGYELGFLNQIKDSGISFYKLSGTSGIMNYTWKKLYLNAQNVKQEEPCN